MEISCTGSNYVVPSLHVKSEAFGAVSTGRPYIYLVGVITVAGLVYVLYEDSKTKTGFVQ